MTLNTAPCTGRDLSRINRLLRQLSGRAKRLNKEKLKQVLAQPNFHLIVARDSIRKNNPIMGMASIYLEETLTGLKGYIEDVIVDAECRGKGLGKRLTEGLITVAKKRKAKHIDLTSNPARIEANAMYQKLGFVKRETNCYRLVLQ